MELYYNNYTFKISFDVTFVTKHYPPFIVRSVLGNELKKLACVLKGKVCDECQLKYHCAYSFIFETPINKNTEFLLGRNKASHPFRIFSDLLPKRAYPSMDLKLSLFGKGIDYFPYMYFALYRAGEKGLFRERIKYSIDEILEDDFVINKGFDENLIIPERRLWKFDSNQGEKSLKLKIYFLSPVRIKLNGKYTHKIGYKDLLLNIFQRVNILSAMYGDKEKISIDLKSLSEKEEKISLRWIDYERYSARQETEMKLGGAVGHIEVYGNFSMAELSLLKAGEIFGVGKNTSFGFGEIKVEEMV